MSSSIASIHGVHMCSGIFSKGFDIDLFNTSGNKPHRASVLFGHNGSGKSTIAGEIDRISKSESNGYLYGENGRILNLGDEELRHIRVFDEKYVETKTRFKSDGLESIVMLGKQVETADAIETIDKNIEETGVKITELQKQIYELEDGEDSVNKLKEKAKKDIEGGGWRNRGKAIRGTNPKFNESYWKELLKIQSDETREKLIEKFEQKINAFNKAENAGTSMIAEISPIGLSPYDEDHLKGLLSRQMENPELSDREQRILDLVRNKKQNMVVDARDIFTSEETHVCPMCQQEVSREYKTSIVKSIRKVLNKDVEEFKTELNDAILPQENVIRSIPEQVSASTKIIFQDAQSEVNELIKKYNDRITQRMENVYTVQTEETLGLAEALERLNGAVEKVNKEIRAINDAINDKKNLENELLAINDKIAWYDARANIKAYKKASDDLKKAETDIGSERKKLGELEAEKAEKQAAMRQINIAIDVINSYLANVYCDSNRFRLVLENERYKVLSHGHPVSPQQISTGERNILALCYFFTEGGEGKERGHEDDNPQYIVLDDPVSSFDIENRVGVCSLLRDRFEQVLQSNGDSKITVLTHDASVADHLQDVFNDLRTMSPVGKFNYGVRRLCGTASEEAPYKESEYKVLLKRVYNYAESTVEEVNESYVIGNILRRVVEGYSTFNYGIGMAKLFREPELTDRLGKDFRILETAMYRLLLNNESHMQVRVGAMNPRDHFEQFSYGEKQSCARGVLVMLYKLDEFHVKKQLRGISEADIEKQIKCWAKQFQAR